MASKVPPREGTRPTTPCCAGPLTRRGGSMSLCIELTLPLRIKVGIDTDSGKTASAWTRRGAMDEKSNHAQPMKFSILLLLTLSPGFNACPALAQESNDHNERAPSTPIKGPLRQSRNS